MYSVRVATAFCVLGFAQVAAAQEAGQVPPEQVQPPEQPPEQIEAEMQPATQRETLTVSEAIVAVDSVMLTDERAIPGSGVLVYVCVSPDAEPATHRPSLANACLPNETRLPRNDATTLRGGRHQYVVIRFSDGAGQPIPVSAADVVSVRLQAGTRTLVELMPGISRTLATRLLCLCSPSTRIPMTR